MFKEIFANLKGQKDVDTTKMVEFLDGVVKSKNENEEALRKQKVIIDQVGDLDLAKLKTNTGWLEDQGGFEAVQSKIAQADGYADDKVRVEKERDEYKSKYEGEVEKTSIATKEASFATFTTSILPQFMDAFREGTPDVLELMKARKEFTEDGGEWKINIGGKLVPADKEGVEIVKEKYKHFVPTPSGGGKAGGVNNNDKGGGNAAYTMEDEFR